MHIFFENLTPRTLWKKIGPDSNTKLNDVTGYVPHGVTSGIFFLKNEFYKIKNIQVNQ